MVVYVASRNRLMELFNYDSSTGKITWRVAHNNRCPIGSEAGWWSKGYRVLTVDRERIPAHQAVWMIVYGQWPLSDLDHIDTDKANNRISNLREATMSQNLANANRRSDNQSGFKSVHWHNTRNKWTAQINIGGKRRHLGLFATAAEAHAAYVAKANEVYGEFARP